MVLFDVIVVVPQPQVASALPLLPSPIAAAAGTSIVDHSIIIIARLQEQLRQAHLREVYANILPV